MMNYSKFEEISLNNIKPEGWLRKYLENQRDGLTGHLEVAGPPFNQAAWSGSNDKTTYEEGDKSDWWPYEQTGYWIDGMIRCGLLLDDDFLIKKAMKHIDIVLDNPDVDGFLGPGFLKEKGKMNCWVHAVFFRALMALYQATGDKRIPSALNKHYYSEAASCSNDREICNLEEILWTYEKTGDEGLLAHALKEYSEFCRLNPEKETVLDFMLSDKASTLHGATFNEIYKIPIIIYIYTGEEKYLKAAVNAYRKLDRDQMLVDGVNSSAEFLKGKDPLDSHETCVISEIIWSMGYLLKATGEVEYADKIERACFNAAPGAVDSKFRALQYFSCPNQVISDKQSNHNLYYRGDKRMSYRPSPGTQCCPGEVNKVMPNYAARMWLQKEDDITVALYGPCRISTKVGTLKQDITIIEETDYPFRETINFRIVTKEAIGFSLNLRIPTWCKKPILKINNIESDLELKSGSFICIKREFANDDCISLTLPMELKLSHWGDGGVAIERGPLVYSLPIDVDWQRDMDDQCSSDEFPAWNQYPKSKWNYALATDELSLKDDVEIVYNDMNIEPWDINSAPIELIVPAREVKGWGIKETKSIIKEAWHEVGSGLEAREVQGSYKLTPTLPPSKDLAKMLSNKIERIRLVPYGCTTLRLTIFPDGK